MPRPVPRVFVFQYDVGGMTAAVVPKVLLVADTPAGSPLKEVFRGVEYSAAGPTVFDLEMIHG